MHKSKFYYIRVKLDANMQYFIKICVSVNVLPSPARVNRHQRGFFQQQLGTDTGTHSQTKHHGERKTLNGGQHEIPSLKAQGLLMRRKRRWWKSQRRDGKQLEKKAPWIGSSRCICIHRYLSSKHRVCTRPSAIPSVAFSLVFLWACQNGWVSDTCACSWDSPVVGLLCSTSIWLVLLHPIIFYFVMFVYYLLEAYSFLIGDRMEIDPEGRGSREKQGWLGGRQTVIRIYYMRKESLLNEKKQQKNVFP